MKRVLLTILALGSLIGLGAFLSFSAFTDTTSNGTNTFETANVEISDNDAGSAMFDLVNLRPGDSAVRCIDVTNSGTVDLESVDVTSAVGGTDAVLADALNVKVEEDNAGGSTPVNPTVEVDFSGQPTDHISTDASCVGADFTAGSNTLHNGTLTALGAATLASSDVDWDNATDETHAYRFTVTLPDTVDNTLEGKNATLTVTWTGSDA